MPAFATDPADVIVSSLEPVPAGTPVTEVARRLLEVLTAGDLEPGTRMPPERRLAESLGVGRSAVREALAALEILGIVDVRPGSGTYVRGSASDLLPQSLRWSLMVGKKNTDQLTELRAGLESYTARLAARRIDAGRRAELERSLADMRAAQEDPAAFVAADRAFHHVLAEAAANPMLTDLLQVSRSLLQVYDGRAVSDPEQMRAALHEHELIHAALVAGDEDAAASAMVEHMATARSRLLDATED